MTSETRRAVKLRYSGSPLTPRIICVGLRDEPDYGLRNHYCLEGTEK